MNIRIKLILRFTTIVATILILFSLAVYILSANYRREEFYSRLESRAISTARLLLSVEEVNTELLRIIERNTISLLPDERIMMYNPNNELIYFNGNDTAQLVSHALLEKIRTKNKLYYTDGEVEGFGMVYGANSEEIVLVASAFDRYGRSKLRNLRSVLIAGLVIGILIILLTGTIFARQVLAPLARMNTEISSISAGNLSQRIDEGNKTDEIAQLAINFNNMLSRLESAFQMQKQFVSNASHELRNPLAAISSQLQLVLDKERSADDYRQALCSLLDDNQTLIKLTNGLLSLAQSEIEERRMYFSPIRVDETLFLAQDELSNNNPAFRFFIEYDSLPEDDAQLTIRGDENLLKTAFVNIMDNACKFSEDHTVYIRLSPTAGGINISFQDKGLGIPRAEQEDIFTPFYRASNTRSTTTGHGIGLSLCRRIVQLHGAEMVLQSVEGEGTSIQLLFRSIV